MVVKLAIFQRYLGSDSTNFVHFKLEAPNFELLPFRKKWIFNSDLIYSSQVIRPGSYAERHRISFFWCFAAITCLGILILIALNTWLRTSNFTSCRYFKCYSCSYSIKTLQAVCKCISMISFFNNWNSTKAVVLWSLQGLYVAYTNKATDTWNQPFL